MLRSLGHSAAETDATRLGERYLRELSRRGDLFPWCRRLLWRFARVCRLGIVTNGIDRVQRARLRAAGLESRFAVVVTSESCGFSKPDPRILHTALSKLGVGPAEAVYVGDDLRVDGGAARAAGMAFWWIDHTGAETGDLPPDWRRFRTLRELALVRIDQRSHTSRLAQTKKNP